MPPIVTVAPTGPIATKGDHPGLPTAPDEIAAEVRAAHEAGAAIAHLHFRDADGRPTADHDLARRTIDLIATQCPILIQVSTGVGLEVDYAERASLVELKPEMATLNPCTMTFGNGEFRNPPAEVRRLAARMRELGVKPELEIYDTGHLDMCLALHREDLLAEPLQFSIVLGVRGGMAATPENLLAMAARLPDGAQWQVVAIGRRNLELTAVALALGGNLRTGLEDVLHVARGIPAAGNAALVERAVGLLRALDHAPATVSEARVKLGLDAVSG